MKKHQSIDTAIVMLNWNGEKLLRDCLASLKKQSYKNFKLIIVDNGSTDGSQALIRSLFPSATLIQNKKNLGFAEPNNQGIRMALKDPKIKFIVTLNNDTVADKNWLLELHDYLAEHDDVGSAQGRILKMSNKNIIDSVGILLDDNFLPLNIGDGKPKDQFRSGRILGPSAGAAIYKRELLEDIKAGRDFFDSRFFAYYEDVDLAIRAALKGWKSMFLYKPVIYHIGSATMGQESPHKLFYLARNRLWFILKNFDKKTSTQMRTELTSYFDQLEGMYSKTGRAEHANALKNGFAASLARSTIFYLSGLKTRTLFRKNNGNYDNLFNVSPPFSKTAIIDGAQKNSPNKFKHKKVLIVSPDVVGVKMAGPGIRYFQLAKELSKFFTVTLATPNNSDLPIQEFKIKPYMGKALKRLRTMIDKSDYIFAQSLNSEIVFYAMRKKKIIIYDFYNPMPVEFLGSLQFTNKQIRSDSDKSFNELLELYQIYMLSGNYFVCSNTRQRDFWIGMLIANKAIFPTNVGKKNIENFIGLVPFGYSPNPPKHLKNVLRGKIRGIQKNDFLLLWAGGIWNWFDPLTLIKAMKLVKDSSVKLVFLGTTHPNKLVGKQSMAFRAIELAKKLKIYNKNVFFLHGWIDYDERANYLLEGDVAVSTHFNTLETRFSFRTRVLDHYWAGLPSIVTKGDSLAEHIEDNDLGITVDYEDVDGIAKAINEIKNDKKMREKMINNIVVARKDYSWPNVATDLITYIKNTSTASIKTNNNFPLLYQLKHSLPVKALKKYGPLKIWKAAIRYYSGSYD